jgi:methylmalonyl-CoA mutase
LATPKTESDFGESEKIYIIPPDRTRYLAEIAESSAAYNLG